MSLNHLVASGTKPWTASTVYSLAVTANLSMGGQITLAPTDFIAYSSNATGPFTVTQAATGSIVRMPGTVALLTIVIPEAAATNAAIITFATALPLGCRPLFDTYASIPIINNSAYATGLMKVATTGVITISTAANAAFTASGTAGAGTSVCVSYKFLAA